MATKGRAPGLVQTRVRLKATSLSKARERAERRGISLNAELVDNIESGTLADMLSEGEFGLSDLRRFQQYVQVLKLAVRAAGLDEEKWLGYARHVPFPVDANDRSAVQKANAAVLSAVDADLAKYRRFLADNPEPDPLVARKRPQGSIKHDQPPEITPDADYGFAKRFVIQVTQHRMRQRPER